MAHININSLENKCNMLTNRTVENIDILMNSETTLDNKFPHALCNLKNSSNPYKLDKNSHGRGILLYVRDDISYNLVKLDQKLENFGCFLIK